MIFEKSGPFTALLIPLILYHETNMALNDTLNANPSGQWDCPPGLVGSWAGYQVIKKKDDALNTNPVVGMAC